MIVINLHSSGFSESNFSLFMRKPGQLLSFHFPQKANDLSGIRLSIQREKDPCHYNQSYHEHVVGPQKESVCAYFQGQHVPRREL